MIEDRVLFLIFINLLYILFHILSVQECCLLLFTKQSLRYLLIYPEFLHLLNSLLWAPIYHEYFLMKTTLLAFKSKSTITFDINYVSMEKKTT